MNVRSALRIIRFPNLLMVAATMYLMRWSIISPLLGVYGLGLQVSEAAFLGLVLSTVCITAAGYLINDYHDTRADQINKPGKVTVDLHIPRRVVLSVYNLLNLAGVGAGIVFSLLYRVPWMILIFMGAPFLLWYYSIRLKHIFLAGNLAISLLTGTVPMLVILFEHPLLARNFQTDPAFYPDGLLAILCWVGAFAFFAFMTNLIREIIKDVEDAEGDREVGSRSLPIVLGTGAVRTVIVALSIVTSGMLAFLFLRYLPDPVSLVYFAVALLLPFIYLIYRTLKSGTKSDYAFLSQWIKVIMLLGLLYAPVVHWLIRNYFTR
jgi:4-hydroxybenzoate polyprenyltransferase